MSELIGKKISHYRIVEQIGQGGMGVVYKAEDTKLKRDVAIKFLPRQIAGNEEERARFKIEAQAAAAINHPNIAAIYAIEEVDGEMFIVMEYIDGQELRHVIAEKSPEFLKLRGLLDIATQIASGLQAAHKKGITHRDIKSANIMVTDEGQVKIMDFGLAKLAGRTQLTKEGSTLGTVAYMSPEQTHGIGVDQRTDIWSFGVVLYEMLTGEQPFKGDYEQAVIFSIMNDDPKPISEIREDVPPDLVQVAEKALRKEPSARYQGVDEMLDSLQSVAEQPGKPSSHSRQSGAEPWVQSKRQRGFLLVMAASLLLTTVLVLAATFLFRVDSATQEQIPIAVVDFSNATGEPELDGLSGMLITALDQSQRLSVLTRARMFDILGQMGKTGITRLDETLGREICRRAGVKALAVPSIYKLGDTYTIDLKVIDIDRNRYFFTAREDGKGQESILTILDNLSERTRKELSEKKAAVLASNRGVAEITTPNLKAYQHYFEGMSLLNKLEFEQADAAFARAIELDSTFALAYLGRAEAFSWVSVNVDAELEKFWAIIDAIPDISRLPDKDRAVVTVLNAHSRRVHDFTTQRFEAELKTIDWQPMAKALQQLETRYPQDEELLYAIGNNLFHAGNPKTALQYFEKVVAVNPGFGRALVHLPVIYQLVGQPEKASEAVKRLLAINEKEGTLRQGLVYKAQGRHKKAIAEFHKVLELDALHRGALSQLAGRYLDIGQPKQALVYASRRVAAYHSLSSYLQLGLVYDSLGDYPKVTETFQEAMQQFPHNAYLLIKLHDNLIMRENNYGQALRIAQELTALYPNNLLFKQLAAWTYRNLGEYEKSMVVLKKIPAIEKTAATFHDLGVLFFAQSNYAEAAAAFRTTVELDSLHTNAKLHYLLMLAKLGRHAAAAKQMDRLHHHIDAWLLPVVRFYLKESDSQAVLEAADEDIQKQTVYQYFMGMARLLGIRSDLQPAIGDTLAGVAHLKKCLEVGPTWFAEVTLAKEELKRLEKFLSYKK